MVEPRRSVIVSGGVRRSAVRRRCRRAGHARARRRSRRPAGRSTSIAEQQAGAAHSARRRALEAGAARSARTWSSSSSSIVVDDGAGRRAGDRVAAEGRARGRPARTAGALVGDEQRADRQAVREALRERRRIGPHAELLPGEEAAGAADAGLHLVEDQHRAVLVGERARGGEELRRRAAGRRPRPARARAGSRPCRRRRRPRASDVVGVAKRDARHSGSNARPLRRLAGDRERAHRAAVERALERDEPGLPGRLARALDRGLDRLGAGVAEERVRAAEALATAARRARSIGSVQ